MVLVELGIFGHQHLYHQWQIYQIHFCLPMFIYTDSIDFRAMTKRDTLVYFLVYICVMGLEMMKSI